MVKEVNDQLAKGSFELITKKDMPTDATLLPAVWQMKQKKGYRHKKNQKVQSKIKCKWLKTGQGTQLPANLRTRSIVATHTSTVNFRNNAQLVHNTA